MITPNLANTHTRIPNSPDYKTCEYKGCKSLAFQGSAFCEYHNDSTLSGSQATGIIKMVTEGYEPTEVIVKKRNDD